MVLHYHSGEAAEHLARWGRRVHPWLKLADVIVVPSEFLARVFASKRLASEKFEAVTHMVAHGVPVLDGALAWLACDLTDLYPAGDHTIGIGEITHMDSDPDGEPLVWFRGHYGEFA